MFPFNPYSRLKVVWIRQYWSGGFLCSKMPCARIHICNHSWWIKIKESDDCGPWTRNHFHLFLHDRCTACNLILVPKAIKETHNTQWDLHEQGIFWTTHGFSQTIYPVWDAFWNMPLRVLVPSLMLARSRSRLWPVDTAPCTVFGTFLLAQCPGSICVVHHVVALSIVARVSFRKALEEHSACDSMPCAIIAIERAPMQLL